MTATDALLSIQGLHAAVEDKEILHGVDLDVSPGEVHVLMGPNGAGKSTLGHVAMGEPTYEVTDGKIIFDGQDITELSPDKRSSRGALPELPGARRDPGRAAHELPARHHHRPRGLDMKRKEFRKRIRKLADELDMDRAYLDRELGVGFSGGEKKKVEMLQLLLLQPKLAILDETDSGLDVDALSVVSHGMELYHRDY
jgi:Fe-S cluster assembly ATP-binding protein